MDWDMQVQCERREATGRLRSRASVLAMTHQTKRPTIVMRTHQKKEKTKQKHTSVRQAGQSLLPVFRLILIKTIEHCIKKRIRNAHVDNYNLRTTHPINAIRRHPSGLMISKPEYYPPCSQSEALFDSINPQAP